MCLALGKLHPDYLLEELTPEQFMEWQQFDALEPIGFIGADMLNGMLVSMIAASAGVKEATPKKFMVSYQEDEEAQAPGFVDKLAKALGAKAATQPAAAPEAERSASHVRNESSDDARDQREADDDRAAHGDRAGGLPRDDDLLPAGGTAVRTGGGTGRDAA